MGELNTHTHTRLPPPFDLSRGQGVSTTTKAGNQASTTTNSNLETTHGGGGGRTFRFYFSYNCCVDVAIFRDVLRDMSMRERMNEVLPSRNDKNM